MKAELLQNGRVLRQITHDNQMYIEAPESGRYEIRLTNDCPRRRMAVISVDGLNIIDGKDAGYGGRGYVLMPWQTAIIKGWLRGSNEAAAFTFEASEGSYANQTGRGTKNTGVVGIAVFEEKEKPVILTPPPVIIKEVHHHHHHDSWPRYTFGTTSNTLGSVSRGGSTTTGNSDLIGATMDLERDSGIEHDSTFTLCSDSGPVVAAAAGAAYSADMGTLGEPISARGGEATKGFTEESSRMLRSRSKAKDVGTGYGQRVSMYTSETDFERASDTPSYIVTLRYAVAEKLREWGVPVPEVHVAAPAPAPDPFPAARGFAQPPAGYRG